MDAGTLHKAIDLLWVLKRSESELGMSELSRRAGFPKSTTHRLLGALSERHLVERDDRGRYRLGFGLLALGAGALDADPVIGAARGILERLSAELDETFFLVGARAGSLRVLHQVEGSGMLRAAPTVGAEVPIHATAAGRLYLAYANELLSPATKSLERFTPQTLTHPSELEVAVARARERGWDENCEEWIPGLRVLSAAILTGSRIRGVLAAAAATPRFEALGRDLLVERLRSAAEEIAHRLEGDEE